MEGEFNYRFQAGQVCIFDPLPNRLTCAQLSLAGAGLTELPDWLTKRYGRNTYLLDLTCNAIKSLSSLSAFENLEELIVDDNDVHSLNGLPHLPKLRTLSLNKNPLQDFHGCLRELSKQVPQITFLSLCFTDICPSELSGCSSEEYQGYRRVVLCYLPGLKFLDSRKVNDEELASATKLGRPDSKTSTCECVTIHSLTLFVETLCLKLRWL